MKRPVTCLLIAAMKEEIASFLGRVQNQERASFDNVRFLFGDFSGETFGVLLCGVGKKRVHRAIGPALARCSPRFAVIAGWAGALTDTLHVGDLVFAENICHWNQGMETCIPANPTLHGALIRHARAAGIAFHSGNLVTADEMVCSEALRERLASDFDAITVEMETYYLMEALQHHEVPACAIRVITDSADERIGVDFNKVPASRARRAAYWLANPVAFSHALRLYRDLRIATRSLNKRLPEILTALSHLR